MTRYQWTVFFAAWLGWGFDVFDGLLFNFVAPVCVPRLLGVAPGDPATAARVAAVTGHRHLGAARRLGDGRHPLRLRHRPPRPLADAAAHDAHLRHRDRGLRVRARRRGRSPPSASSPASASAASGRPARASSRRSCRASRRVAAGALLYTSAPVGILLAGLVNDVLTKRIAVLAAQPDLAWRLVFLTGLLPARVRALDPAPRATSRRCGAASAAQRPRLARALRARAPARDASAGSRMCLVTLVTWWATNAFLPFVVGAPRRARTPAPPRSRGNMTCATLLFKLGGFLGTLATIPLARLGRRPLFAHLPRRRGAVDLDDLRSRLGAGDAHAAPLPRRPHRLRRRRRLQLLPARAVPDAAARHGQRLLLQHRVATSRPPGRSSSAGRSARRRRRWTRSAGSRSCRSSGSAWCRSSSRRRRACAIPDRARPCGRVTPCGRSV